MMFFEPCKRIKEFKKINNKIKEEIIVIASERDSEIFFNAISKPKKSSENLKKALKEYNEVLNCYETTISKRIRKS